MKTLIHTGKTAFVMMTLALLSACGQGSNIITANSNNPGAGISGANIDMKTCQVGQIYSTQYGCLVRASCQSGAGIALQTNSCVRGQVVTEEMKYGRAAGTRHFGKLTITNNTQAELLLQAAGLCSSGYGTSIGMTAMTRCSQWIQRGAFAIVKSYSQVTDNVNIMLGAGSTFPADLVPVFPGVYGYSNNSMYSNSNYISFSQQAHSYKYNSGNGMQIVGVTSTGSSVNLMMLIDNGSLGSDRIENAQLVYQGVEVAKITLDRF